MKSTLVSIMPFAVNEEKPGIYPGVFQIPASKDGSPQVLVIDTSKYHVPIDENRAVTVPVPSDDMAKSVVDDYLMGMLGVDRAKGICPGFFWLEGEVKKEDVVAKHSGKLKEAQESQHRWFIALVKEADDTWEQFHQHRYISDVQRHAAKVLGTEKPWIVYQKDIAKTCPACASEISHVAVICPICKYIVDKKKYDEMSFAVTK